MRPFVHRAVFVTLFVLLAAIVAFGCSETSVDVADLNNDPAPGDTSLPNGFVTTNRPANPATSFIVPCPLGVVPDGAANPNVTLGCPLIECIPAIDNPEYAKVKNAGVAGFERIVAVEIDGQIKGFPIRILIHHEIVNICWDLSDGSTLYTAISYCPIVDMAVHFRPDYDCSGGPGKNYGYGVSSALYNGNLIIYRRGTAGDVEGSFVQIYGGGLNNECFVIEPVNIDMPVSLFALLYPNGEVLTENTGLPKPDGGYDVFDHPYAEFWLGPDLCVNGLCFPISETDDRLPLKEYVYGVYTPSATKVYPTDKFNRRVVNDVVGGINVVLFNDRNATVAFEAAVEGQALTFSLLGREAQGLPLYEDEETGSLWTFDGIAVRGPLKDKRLAQMIGYRGFWFAWNAFFPGSTIFEF